MFKIPLIACLPWRLMNFFEIHIFEKERHVFLLSCLECMTTGALVLQSVKNTLCQVFDIYCREFERFCVRERAFHSHKVLLPFFFVCLSFQVDRELMRI